MKGVSLPRLLCFFLWLTCAGSAIGCVNRMADFHVREIASVRVHDIDESGFEMTVLARVENPNRVSARVSDIRFHTSMDGAPLGQGRVPGPVEAVARSIFDLHATVRVPFADLPADLPARVAGGILPLTVMAAFVADTKLGRFPMRLTARGDTAIAEALQVLIEGGLSGDLVKVTRLSNVALGLTGVRLRVRVALRNALPFPVQVQRGDVALLLGHRQVGHTRIERGFTLPARARIHRDVEVHVGHGDMLRAGRSLMNGELAVGARGTLFIEPIGGVERIPFEVATDLSVIESL